MMVMRAMMMTMVMVGLAMLAVGLYVAGVAGMVGGPVAATAPAGRAAAGSPERGLQLLFRGTMTLAGLLVMLVLLVGMMASWRAWLRYRTEREDRKKTQYVDAWKIAGERLKTPENGDEID